MKIKCGKFSACGSHNKKVFDKMWAKERETMQKEKDKLKTLKKCCELLEKRLQCVLKDKEQFNRYILSEKEGSDTKYTEKVFKKTDEKAIKTYVGILKELSDIKRDLFEIERTVSETNDSTGVILIASKMEGQE